MSAAKQPTAADEAAKSVVKIPDPPFWLSLLTHPDFAGLSRHALLQLSATLGARGPPDELVFTINEFCAAHKISRSQLYKLWKQGRGPRTKHVGSKVLITAESAAEWRAADETTQAA
jgi:predicted DNA-binding transcriptional regulator AlpA